MFDKIDDSLIVKAKNKDSEAELEIIERFKPLILSKARRYNLEKLPQEDYLQEGIVVILEAVQSFDFDRKVPFAAYVERQMFYHFVEKTKYFRYVESLNAQIDEELFLIDLLPAPEAEFDPLVADETHESLKKCFSRLRFRERWLIVNYYYKNRSLNEIASSLELSSNCLSQCHIRTLAKLKKLLKTAGVNWEDTPYAKS